MRGKYRLQTDVMTLLSGVPSLGLARLLHNHEIHKRSFTTLEALVAVLLKLKVVSMPETPIEETTISIFADRELPAIPQQQQQAVALREKRAVQRHISSKTTEAGREGKGVDFGKVLEKV